MYYVYILKSFKDEKLYIGYTHDLGWRLNQHKNGLSKAPKYRLPVELVYYEAYKDKEDARRREKGLKQFGQSMRKLRERMIGSISSNPLCEVSAG